MTPTPEQIVAWAREAGIEWQQNTGITGRTRTTTCGSQSLESMQRFAALACAWQAEQDHPFRPSVDGDAATRASVKGPA